MARHFSVDEANALLPRIRALVEAVLAARQRILDVQPEVWPALEKAIGNGGSKKAGALVEEFKKIERGIQAIQDLGIVVKDINTGLVDFPALHGDREVFLCWQYNEPAVAYWHELQTGYAGRQPIDWK
ncbi:MAG TPA: DUF2203 domain-containing protein [Anaerolineae bacterium]|nr:DUF2203 domain-containing protein [Anaerolineae bacterium]